MIVHKDNESLLRWEGLGHYYKARAGKDGMSIIGKVLMIRMPTGMMEIRGMD